MTNNLFQVLSASDVTEILNEHTESLIIIMFSSKTCSPCKLIKPTFVQSSRDNSDCYFLYVDISKFEDKNVTFTNDIQGTPKFSYYFNNQEIAYILGGDKNVFINTLQDLKNKIEAKKREILLYESENKQKELMKTEMLQNLNNLAQNGVKLSKNYNINSDYNEMKWEYEYHLRIINQQQPQSDTQQGQQQGQQQHGQTNPNDTTSDQGFTGGLQNNPILDKQEKLKKIQELTNLNNMMQMQQMMRIQQLRKLQQMKEQGERTNNEKNN